MKVACGGLALALACGAAAAQEAQGRRAVATREFTIVFHMNKKVTPKALWVSRDGGKSWKTAGDAGVTEKWAEYDPATQSIDCTVRVPEDGPWDFAAELADRVGLTTPAPRPGQAAVPRLRYDVREEGRLQWISPRADEEFIAGNQVIFRWMTDKKGLREKSVTLYWQIEGQPWNVVSTALDLEGRYVGILPQTSATARIRFRLSAFTLSGAEVTSKELAGTVMPGQSVVGLAWDTPRGRPEWAGGTTVTLRWTSLGPEFRERSADLAYQLEDEPWTLITRGLEATGSYLWVVPNRETARLRLRVRALTRAGQEAAATTEHVSVKVTERPNIVLARELYDRARILAAQGRTPEAMLKYGEALQAWSEFGEVYNDLGTLHADMKDYPKALENFLRARKACPSDPVPYVNAAMMLVRMGLLEDAMADLRDALALGVDRSPRSAALAGEMLLAILADAQKAQNWDRVRAAAEMILSIRHASPRAHARAREQLDWLSRPRKGR